MKLETPHINQEKKSQGHFFCVDSRVSVVTWGRRSADEVRAGRRGAAVASVGPEGGGSSSSRPSHLRGGFSVGLSHPMPPGLSRAWASGSLGEPQVYWHSCAHRPPAPPGPGPPGSLAHRLPGSSRCPPGSGESQRSPNRHTAVSSVPQACSASSRFSTNARNAKYSHRVRFKKTHWSRLWRVLCPNDATALKFGFSP